APSLTMGQALPDQGLPSSRTRRSSDLAGGKSTAKATPHKPATGHGGQAAAVPSPKGAPTLPRVTSQAQTARGPVVKTPAATAKSDRKSTRLNSSHDQNSYAVFCLKKKT